MAATDAELCNVALLRVGQRQLIEDLEDLDDDTAEAEACRALFPHARDLVLESFPWQFATRRAALAVLTGAERDGWDFVYAAPAGMAAPQFIWAGIVNPPPEGRPAWEMEDGDGDTTGPIILTDTEDAVLVYTTNALTIARYPRNVQDVIAWKLAAELAGSLLLKPAVQERMEAKYERRLAQVAAQELNRRQKPPPLDAEHIRVR